MFLTQEAIKAWRTKGHITIEPFDKSQLNPDSYDYRLGPELLVPHIGPDGAVSFEKIDIPAEGYVLQPRLMYLGSTLETLGSDTFVMSLIGKRSVAELGVKVQIDADLGHIGACHRWTLEIVTTLPARLYAGERIGQIMYAQSTGLRVSCDSDYANCDRPQTSKLRQKGRTP